LYLDSCVTDYVIVQRNKERTLKEKTDMVRLLSTTTDRPNNKTEASGIAD
jgi:hypothetical protein